MLKNSSDKIKKPRCHVFHSIGTFKQRKDFRRRIRLMSEGFFSSLLLYILYHTLNHFANFASPYGSSIGGICLHGGAFFILAQGNWYNFLYLNTFLVPFFSYRSSRIFSIIADWRCPFFFRARYPIRRRNNIPCFAVGWGGMRGFTFLLLPPFLLIKY